LSVCCPAMVRHQTRKTPFLEVPIAPKLSLFIYVEKA